MMKLDGHGRLSCTSAVKQLYTSAGPFCHSRHFHSINYTDPSGDTTIKLASLNYVSLMIT